MKTKLKKGNTFTCEECGDTFTADWNDADAVEETRRLFGDKAAEEDCAIVCGTCFAKVLNRLSVRN